MQVLSPRQEAKRDHIRTAAASLFLAHGFADTSMDAVTAVAGISKETLYRYYESKASLFSDVLGQLISEPSVTRTRKEPRPQVRNRSELEAELVDLSAGYLGRVMQPKQLALLRIVIAEGSRFPDLVAGFRTTLPALGGALISDVLDAGRDAGVLAEWIDVRTAARAFAGLLMMFILGDGLLSAKPKRPDRNQLALMVRIFVNGVGSGG